MRNLIALIVRFGSFLTFLVLEILCLILIVTYNPSQRDIYLNSSNLFAGSILSQRNKIDKYLSLEETNEKLQKENAELKEEMLLLKGFNQENNIDTTLKFELIPAAVIKQEYRLRNNHITLDKGLSSGIEKDMGVISSDGIVGIVKGVSKNYARAMSILNMDTRIGAMIKSTGHFGPLVWKGSDPQFAILESIPRYAEITVGDTIITSGHSTIFPKGINIGRVESFDLVSGTSFYALKVKLTTDMTKLDYVYVIENLHKSELDTLELINE